MVPELPWEGPNPVAGENHRGHDHPGLLWLTDPVPTIEAPPPMKSLRSIAALCSALLLAAALGCSPDRTPTAPPPADLSLIGDLTNTVGDVTGTVTDLAGQVLPIKGLLACNVTQTYSTTQSVG